MCDRETAGATSLCPRLFPFKQMATNMFSQFQPKSSSTVRGYSDGLHAGTSLAKGMLINYLRNGLNSKLDEKSRKHAYGGSLLFNQGVQRPTVPS